MVGVFGEQGGELVDRRLITAFFELGARALISGIEGGGSRCSGSGCGAGRFPGGFGEIRDHDAGSRLAALKLLQPGIAVGDDALQAVHGGASDLQGGLEAVDIIAHPGEHLRRQPHGARGGSRLALQLGILGGRELLPTDRGGLVAGLIFRT